MGFSSISDTSSSSIISDTSGLFLPHYFDFKPISFIYTLLGFSSEGGGRRSAEEAAGGGREATPTDNHGGSESHVLRVRFQLLKGFHFISIRNISRLVY